MMQTARVWRPNDVNFQSSGPRRFFHHDQCSMCLEAIDFTDCHATICFCGNKVCGWCFGHIMDNQNGQCPECAGPIFVASRGISEMEMPRHGPGAGDRFLPHPHHSQSPHLGPQPHPHPLNGAPGGPMERMPSFNHQRDRSMTRDRSSSVGHGPGGLSLDRRSLQNLRVIQRHLIYVIGLPPSLSSIELLASADFFGQYGKVVKVVVNTHEGVAPDDPRYGSVSAYITFQYRDDARAAIRAVDGFWLEGRHLRASFGTTKYCNNFARSLPCTNPDCLYLHELGDPEDRFTKEEIQAGLARQHAAMDRDFVLTGKVMVGGASGTGLRPNKPVLPPPQMELPVHPSNHGPGMPNDPDVSHVSGGNEYHGNGSPHFPPTSPAQTHPPRPLPPRQSQNQNQNSNPHNQGTPMGMTHLMHHHSPNESSPPFDPRTPPMKPRLPPRASPSATSVSQKWMQVEAHHLTPTHHDFKKSGSWYATSLSSKEGYFAPSQTFATLAPPERSSIFSSVADEAEEHQLGVVEALASNAGRRAMSLDSNALSALEQRQKGYNPPQLSLLAQLEAIKDFQPQLQQQQQKHRAKDLVHRTQSLGNLDSFLLNGNPRGFAHSAVFPMTRNRQASSKSDVPRSMESDLSIDPYASPDLRSVKVADFLDTSLPPVDCHTPQTVPAEAEDSIVAPFLLPEAACPSVPGASKGKLCLNGSKENSVKAPVSIPVKFSLLGKSPKQCRTSAPPGFLKPLDGSNGSTTPESEEELVLLDSPKFDELTLDVSSQQECGKDRIIWGSFKGTELDTPIHKTPSSRSLLLNNSGEANEGQGLTFAANDNTENRHNFSDDDQVASSLGIIQQMFPAVKITLSQSEKYDFLQSNTGGDSNNVLLSSIPSSLQSEERVTESCNGVGYLYSPVL